MKRLPLITGLGGLGLLTFVLAPACHVVSGSGPHGTPGPVELAPAPPSVAHRDLVMTSAFCGKCHTAIYAEHNQNTHGRAFTDREPRLATGRFAHGDCIRCHTPRPIFETGIGMNPMTREHNLEDGNSCMTCHWRPDYDYEQFHGGAQCKSAFHPDVGKVEACASCHRNHGTPYQWEKAPLGKGDGKTCMDCHMRKIRRPVAIGEKPRLVRSHVFPGSRSERQLRAAYTYEPRIEGNAVIVKITNSGTGHNFPTELKQRAVESLIIVKDAEGKEQYRSLMVFRDPYKRPYGLHLQVNTQIPSGEFREHRVPLKVASGTVQTELHYKLYYPIENHHPELARQLERRELPFDGVDPSDEEVVSEPEVKVIKPEGTTIQNASAANLVDFVRPKIGKTKVEVPTGSTPQDIERLVQLFMFPVPEAQTRAREALLNIGRPAVPALIEALGSWDNKTFKNAAHVLFAMGDRVRPDLRAATASDQLYIRVHARQLLADLDRPIEVGELTAALVPGLSLPNAIDQSSAAEAIGRLRLTEAIPQLRPLLGSRAPDVVREAALALARLDDKESVPAIRAAMAAASFVETRCDLAGALAMLGNADGIPLLIQGLDYADDLIRERFFELFFAVTGIHKGYDPNAPRPQRLEAVSRIAAYWAREGGVDKLRKPWPPSQRAHEHAWHLVEKLNTGEPDADRDRRIMDELVGMGDDAVPALVLGLKFPAGFKDKRASILACLMSLRRKSAAPFVAAVLRDPVVGVAAWACAALGQIKDPDTLPALQYYHSDLLSKRAAGELPASAGHPDGLIARSAATRLALGDETAKSELINFLMSDDLDARRTASAALVAKYGDRVAYDPAGDAAGHRKAARAWLGQ